MKNSQNGFSEIAGTKFVENTIRNVKSYNKKECENNNFFLQTDDLKTPEKNKTKSRLSSVGNGIP